MHLFTNKLEYFKVGWSLYVDHCDNKVKKASVEEFHAYPPE